MATSKKKIKDAGLRRAVAAAGSRYQLAKALKIGLSSLTRWRQIPPRRVIEIERLFSIDREQLRPDLYPPRDQ
jgi:DNA-binding transcriptional regulator YdaS (Cro superfamily)